MSSHKRTHAPLALGNGVKIENWQVYKVHNPQSHLFQVSIVLHIQE